MSFYINPDIFDNGLASMATRATAVVLIDSYSTSFAAVNGALKVASAALVSGDFALADGTAPGSRKITAAITGKAGGNALKSVADGTPMHIAIIDATSSEVLLVTEESTDQAILIGNPITFDANIVYTLNPPA